jgi:TonB-linked SusC/RagA family outer membrane protein
MKTKLKVILTLLLAFFVQISFAQEKTVSGTVSDSSGTLPGVSVLIRGTTTGTDTDFDGKYTIKASTGDVLVFSYVGYKNVQKTVGSSNTINISMLEDENVLDEIVVTALGLNKQKRAIGYATEVVKGDELTNARESNIVNSLQGKVTGVQVTQSSGNLGSSSRVIIRGVSSLTGNNQPIWVVDGVIINNSQSVSNGSRISGNRDFANGASVINPDDVESMNILKGAAATALYGSRAAAGAIIVTTKKGRSSEDGTATVSISSSLRLDDLFRIPDYQQEYAQGTNGKYGAGSNGFDWGPRIAGQIVPNLPITGRPGPLRAIKDNGIKDFFNVGETMINNFAISDANEKMDYRLSLTSLNQVGLLPGASLDRITASFNAGVRHNDKLESRFGIQYIKTKSKGTGASGANDPNIIGLSFFSSTLDPKLFSPWKDESGNQINHITADNGNLSNNPLWLRNENSNDRNDDRFIGNYSITYKPINNLSLTGRMGFDFEDDKRFLENSKGTINRLEGDFNSDNILREEITIDLLATYSNQLTTDLNLNITAGMQYNSREFERQRIVGNNLLIPELFSPGNVEQTVGTRAFSEQKLYGVFGSAELDYKNYATLTLTARNDFNSTLPLDNNSYFYPSASLAFVFTDAFNIESDILSYGKFRASWAQVGNGTAPYQLDFTYFPITTANGQYGLDINFPFNGALAYSASTTIPPADLLPEQQTSYEFGLETRLFNNRIGIDFAYFNNRNENQIVAVPIPQSTGFSNRTQNVGRVDQTGFELAIDADIFKSENFTWNTQLNYSTVESEVVSLGNDLERFVVSSVFNSVQVVAVPGKPFQLSGFDYLREETTGRPIIDPTTGRRQAGEVVNFGSVLPDWTGGIVNTFRYKNITLSTTIDASWGGVMKSSTVENLQTGGLVQETVNGREGTFIDTEGVLVDANGNVSENNVPLLNAQDFWTSLNDGSVATPWVYDATYVKLREISIFYNLPSEVLEKSFLKSVTLGIEGRNLALLYSKVPHIDPEASLQGSGANGFGIERSNAPSTRSIGFNVRLTF